MREFKYPTNTLPNSGASSVGTVYAPTVPTMSTAVINNRKPHARPLSDQETLRGLRVAGRIHADLIQVIEQLPAHARGGSGMSRHLEIVRNTCQRICYAIQDEPNLQTLGRLPGVKGLHQFVEAARRVGVNAETADLLVASINEFSRLIDDIAGSHSKLNDRLDANIGNPVGIGGSSDINTRANLYAVSSQLTGGGCQTAVSINIIDLHDEKTLSRTYIHGFIGASIAPSGMPLVVCSGDNLRWAKKDWDHRLLDDTGLKGRTPTALIEPFTSSPKPEITGRGKEGQLLQVIDPSSLEAGEQLDVVTATRTTWPLVNPETNECAFERVWYLVNWPVQNLVFDVYLHEKLERMFRPSIDALLWYPGLSIPGGDKWATRFPSQTKLELLGRGISASHSALWHRHGELTQHTFDRIQEEPGDYVGFRCEVQYPIWRAGYCMSFEELQKPGE